MVEVHIVLVEVHSALVEVHTVLVEVHTVLVEVHTVLVEGHTVPAEEVRTVLVEEARLGSIAVEGDRLDSIAVEVGRLGSLLEEDAGGDLGIVLDNLLLVDIAEVDHLYVGLDSPLGLGMATVLLHGHVVAMVLGHGMATVLFDRGLRHSRRMDPSWSEFDFVWELGYEKSVTGERRRRL